MTSQKTSESYTLAKLAELTQAKLVGDPAHKIFHVADLESATGSDASFYQKPSYKLVDRNLKALEASEAGVIFLSEESPKKVGRNYLVTPTPSRAFQITVEMMTKERQKMTYFSGIHPTVIIHETAKIGDGVNIGPYCVIDGNVVIGNNTQIGAGTIIGPNTTIGSECQIHPRVAIREFCVIGDRVIIQPGAVIGSCGFGYTTNEKGEHIKLNQVGDVVIEDDAEIGANTAVDRARFKTTRVCKGSKVDNLVDIGHGVEIGEHNLIIGQTGIAGSAKTGKHVIIAGQCGINGHINITDQVIIAGRSGVTKSITKPGRYGGLPVLPIQEYNRNSVTLRNINRIVASVKELEERVNTLEKDI